jgi:transposase
MPGGARDHGMLLRLDGKSGPEMAPWLDRDEDTIRGWGHAFTHSGLQGLERELLPGRPA